MAEEKDIHAQHGEDQQSEDMFDPSDAAEEIVDEEEAAMDSGSEAEGEGDQMMEDEEIQLENDSLAHFDKHTSSIFSIAQHPIHSNIITTGGGDDVAYLFNSTPSPSATPVLPASYQTAPQSAERESINHLQKFDGHTDSVNAITFTFPAGEYLLSAGLDGQLRAYQDKSPKQNGIRYDHIASVSEVPEINWLSSCPSNEHPNVVALGASDGSVWVYQVDASSPTALTILQAYYLHTESCTAGAWTPDGKMLATVSEDSSFCVWDPFGEAVAAGVTSQSGQAVLNLTAQDQRFAVEGGLFSVAVEPKGAFAVVGGAGGIAKAVGLPRIGATPQANTKAVSKSKKGAAKPTDASASSGGGAGQILASLQAQGDGIESLSFAPAPITLLAAASVDGSIVLFDTAHRFAVRRHIREAHEEHAVVKVEFAPKGSGNDGWVLTSAGMDGVVRKWDTRGGTAAPANGLLREWRGHRGGGEGGGILGFVQGGKDGTLVTAGDDGIALVFGN